MDFQPNARAPDRPATSGHQEPVQDLAWPAGTCHGCGPANEDGLQLKSYLSEAVIEHVAETADLTRRLGDPAGSVPARFSVQGVLHYLDLPVR